MTAWDFADRHLVFVALAFFSTLALIGLCTLARLAWRTEDAVMAVGKKFAAWTGGEKGTKS
jgi:hypothetical protein